VIIPARLASTRLPRKPLVDIAGLPMVVRVAQRAAASGARTVVVAADSDEITAACREHNIMSVLTSPQHATGTDRLAEACSLLALAADTVVVNVQGDEPLIEPSVIADVAAALARDPNCAIATAAHPIKNAAEFFNPNVVKVELDARGRALTFSRAPLPWSRDAFARDRSVLPAALPALRHIGIYAYRVSFLLAFPTLARAPIEEHEALEQMRALWHGFEIAVLSLAAPLAPGVDTREDLARVRSMFANI